MRRDGTSTPKLKVLDFQAERDRIAREREEREKEVDKEDTAFQEEMASMLEDTLESVRNGEITGFVFIGRKKPSATSAGRFEYIIANACDVGLIGEIHVINTRLAHMYDVQTDQTGFYEDGGYVDED